MKGKIINKDDEQFGKEFKIRRLNYDKVVVLYPCREGFKDFTYDDVEIISEGEIDDFLIQNKDLLKIKLNRGISIMFYKFLLSELEREISDNVSEINLLRDKYKVNKRGVWEKELVMVVNQKNILKIMASGSNFKREGYSIDLIPLTKEEFLEGALGEINRLEKEIKIREIMLAGYGKAIKDIESTEKNPNVKLLK